MLPRSAVIAAVLLLGPSASIAQQATPINFFIGAAMRGGFVETSKQVQDSIKDLTGKLRGAKGMTIVSTRDAADLRVVVTARGTGSEYFGQRLSFSDSYRGAEITSTPMSQSTWWVASTLEVVGTDYRKEFVGSYTHPPTLDYYGGAWTECAKQLAKDLMTWVEANAEQLRARQKGGN